MEKISIAQMRDSFYMPYSTRKIVDKTEDKYLSLLLNQIKIMEKVMDYGSLKRDKMEVFTQ